MFDIEIIFIYPYAIDPDRGRRVRVRRRSSSSRAVFFLTFVYVVARGGLDWGPLQRYAHMDVDAASSAPNVRRRPPSAASVPKVVRPRGGRLGGPVGLVNDLRDDGLAGLPHNIITEQARGARQVGPLAQLVAGDVRARLLRDRDDGHRWRPLRHLPLRHGGLPGVAPPGRHHDRRRAGQPEDGARAAPGLRPDDGAQVGDLDGRVRIDAVGCSTTTPSSRASTRSCRSTCTRRAARRRRRRCSTPSRRCTSRSRTAS